MDVQALADVYRGTFVADKYVIGELLGAGGMGLVFAAEQRGLGRTVAVKFLRDDLVADPEAVARFRTEALAGSRVNHPNVATVIDYGVTAGGVPFLVMELLAGLPLGRMIEAEGAFELARLVSIAGQLLAALGELHARGIVHADVKSDNVLVEQLRDGTEVVKLIDFGLARLAPPAPGAALPAMLSGTPEYLAPEVILGDPPTPASDVYGAGVVLYELLTGTTPFGGGSSAEVLARTLEEDVVAPSLRCPERAIPNALERVVMRALERDPAARFATAIPLAAALAAAVPRGELLAARAPHRDTAPPPRGFSTEAPTRSFERHARPGTPPRRRVAGGTPVAPHRTTVARARIGKAIAASDFDAIVAGYLELARALVDAHHLAAAASELEQAVDVLTVGEGPAWADAPAPLWRVLLTLAAVYDGLGDPTRARRAARAGAAHAQRTNSALGEQRASELLARLGRGRKPVKGGPCVRSR